MKQDIILSIKNSLKSSDFNSSVDLSKLLDIVSVERTKNNKNGDFSCNIAMILAKKLKISPIDAANKIASNFVCSGVAVHVAPPGFINFTLSAEFLSKHLQSLENINLSNPINSKKNIIVDYSSPNLAKEMHVGHLRSSIIGDSLVRIFLAAGFNVIKQNHIGDWGTQFGMLLAYMEEMQKSTNSAEFSLQDLELFYKK